METIATRRQAVISTATKFNPEYSGFRTRELMVMELNHHDHDFIQME